MEQHLCVRHGGHQGKQSQDDRHRATQAKPADEGDLPWRIPKRQQARCHGQRPRDEHQHSGGQQRVTRDIKQATHIRDDAQNQEHAGLRQPGKTVTDTQHIFADVNTAVRNQHPGQINRQEAASTQQVGQRKGRQAAGLDQQRVQTFFKAHACDRQRKQVTEGDTHEQADAELLHEQRQQRRQRLLRHPYELDHAQRQEHRHRIVDAGLHLERGLDPLIEAQATAAEKREGRRRVRRADDRTQQ